MSSSLKQKTLSGVIWSGLQRFGTMGISFISNIVLARMLSPDDYGCIGMLMIFIALSNTFIDGGFGSALIQKKRPTLEDYSTIFHWNIFLSVVLYFILYLCAPFIAEFYDIALLTDVLRIQGLVLIINAFGIIQANQLRKQLQFKIIAIVSIIATLFSVIIAIVLAYYKFGVWSLVVQQLVASFVSTVLYWLYSKWRPLLLFSINSFTELFGFGSYILLSSLINTFCNNFNGLLIGRYFNASSLGYFTQAKKLEDVFSTSIEAVVLQVSYPVLVEVKDDCCRLQNVLCRFNSLLLYVVSPIMLLLNLLSAPIISLVLGNQWLSAAPYLEILAFQGVAIALQGLSTTAIQSIGLSNVLFRATIVKRIVQIFSLLLGMHFGGIIGLLWASTLYSFFAAIYNACLVHKYIQYRLFSQFLDLLPILLLSFVTYFITYSLQIIIPECTFLYILMLFVFIVSYIILSYIFKINVFTYIYSYIQNKYVNRHRKFL